MGPGLKAASDAAGGTKFARVEDGEYDPTNFADFYFDTTGNGTVGSPLRNGRLYRLTFNDLSNPLAGGTITMLLDGTEGMVSPDNLAINNHRQMLINEDPNYILVGRDASIWLYDIPTGNFNRVMEMDSALAISLDPAYTFGKWETSGVVDASSVIGDGWWLFNVQAHYNLADPELVQGGQVLAAKVATSVPLGDATGDGAINVQDLLRLINTWGPCRLGGPCTGDLDQNGVVNVIDLLIVISNWSN
jgi:hypothetical protein